MTRLRSPDVRNHSGRATALVTRVAGFAILWWVAVEGAVESWAIAAVSVIAVTAISAQLIPLGSAGWRPFALLRFLPYFLRESIRGGIDVSRRAFHPRLPIDPGFIQYPLRLPDGPGRIFFAATVSLTPGTLGARIEENVLNVHVLDVGAVDLERISGLEAHVGAIFGHEVAEGGGTNS